MSADTRKTNNEIFPEDALLSQGEPDLTKATAVSESSTFFIVTKQWLTSLRTKLIVPFGVLTVITAVVGIFMLSRYVTSSIVDRYNNQLIEASTVAADGIVRRERTHLETLRLMVFTQGVAQAIFEEDAETLEDILFPLARNYNVDALFVVNKKGEEIFSLVFDPETDPYRIDPIKSQGGDLSSYQIVTRILLGYIDEQGDKYASIEQTTYGPFLFTSAPVRDENNEIKGVMIIGTSFEVLIKELKDQSLSDIVILDENGSLLATTFATSLEEDEKVTEELELSPKQISSFNPSYSSQLNLYEREYQGYYSYLSIREDDTVGIIGIALPLNFIINTETTSRNTLSIIFTIGTIAIIGAGYLLSQNIAKPILKLRNVSMAVSSGNLDQRSEIERSDEIGQLATAFDLMTSNLHERTMEVTKLYSESVERSEELTEINQQLQDAQEQLLQSEKLSAIGQLAAGIVHDVRNPLANIMGLAEEVRFDIGEDSPDSEVALKMIIANASRATDIVSDLMLFARQSDTKPKYQDINETIISSMRLTEYLARKSKIEVKTQLESPPPVTIYDSQQIGQVLINLIQNAIQAMPNGGELNLSSSQNRKWVEITIEDTGVGIPKKNLNKIFDPFFSTKPEGEGTGLGLSVSYGIITQHKGKIEVKSKVKKGTAFLVKLPRKKPDAK